MKPWEARDKALIHVSHTTQLRYSEPVVEAHSEVRKTPVNTGLQRVLTTKLEVDPATRLFDYVDYWGSHVHAFNLLEPHEGVEIRSEAVVETTDAICCGPGVSYDLDQRAIRTSEFRYWSPLVPDIPHYREIPNPVDPDLEPDAFVASLQELGAEFLRRFRYDPAATDVHSSPEVLFREGGGVCQDLAHALIGVLRSGGVPARYVSGYVYDPVDMDDGDRVRGAAASHAWVQAWHPGLGWVGIDPTNDKMVDWQYVRIAAGRDYADVQPLRGVFVGAPWQELEVRVEVRRIG